MRFGESSHKYDDMLDLPHPVSKRRGRMSAVDRAAQFSPFAALTGFDDVIDEAGRLTDARIELDEGSIAALNETLREILEKIDTQPRVRVTYFVYDERKAGGAYLHAAGNVKKIDRYSNTILFTDGTAIPIADIFRLEQEDAADSAL